MVLSEQSTADLRGGQLAGSSSGSPAGQPVVARSGSSNAFDPGATPAAADLLGTSARGGTIDFELDAAPGSLAVLVLAYDATLVPLQPFLPGSILGRPALNMGPYTVPSTGTVRVPFQVPSRFPLGQTYFGQFLAVEPDLATFWVSNALSWHTSQ
ncbi:MAG: hypothetical protein AAF628_01700 [Planctomycetota bacterium]